MPVLFSHSIGLWLLCVGLWKLAWLLLACFFLLVSRSTQSYVKRPIILHFPTVICYFWISYCLVTHSLPVNFWVKLVTKAMTHSHFVHRKLCQVCNFYQVICCLLAMQIFHIYDVPLFKEPKRGCVTFMPCSRASIIYTILPREKSF